MAERLSDNVAMLMRTGAAAIPWRAMIWKTLSPSSTAAQKSLATLPPRRRTSVRRSPFDSVNFWHDGTQRTLSPLSSYRTLRARTVCRSCLIGSALSTPPAMTEAAH